MSLGLASVTCEQATSLCGTLVMSESKGIPMGMVSHLFTFLYLCDHTHLGSQEAVSLMLPFPTSLPWVFSRCLFPCRLRLSEVKPGSICGKKAVQAWLWERKRLQVEHI